MYSSDWNRLGIAPTRELPAIKRAYALRLRTTRPDDDAQAYQALREAYERAQYWARHVVDDDEVPAPAPEEVVVAPTEEPVMPRNDVQPEPRLDAHDAPPAPALDPEPLDLVQTPHDETPEALTRRAFDCWREHGDIALLDEWPRIEAALSRLPLSQRAEASARFADVVISAPNLPVEFLRGLQDHFGWLGDFRTDRMIGPARAEALRQALAEVLVQPVTDPHIRHQLADVLRLHHLLQQPSPLWAWLHAALIGWPLQRQVLEAGSRLLLGLGIDVGDQRKLNAAMKFGYGLRLIALAALVYAGSVLVSDDVWVAAAGNVVVTGVASVIGFSAMLIVGTKLSSAFNGGVQWAAPLARGLARWRSARFGPLSGLVVMGLGTGLFALGVDHTDPVWLWLSATVCVVVGTVPCWPARPDRGVVAAGVWGFLLVCLMRTAPREGLLGVMLGVSGVCTLLGVLLSEGRWRLPSYNFAWYIALVLGFQVVRHGLSQWGPQSAFVWLMVAVIAVSMPWLTLARAHHDGHRFALASMALAGGVVVAAGRAADGPGLLIAWLAATCVLMVLQRSTQWLAARWAGSASPSD